MERNGKGRENLGGKVEKRSFRANMGRVGGKVLDLEYSRQKGAV